MSGTIQSVAVAVLVLCVLPVVESGCGGPPGSDRSALLKALNRDEAIAAKGGKIGSITFGSKSNDDRPFEAVVVDNQGQRLGVVKGTVNEGASVPLKQNHALLWLSKGAATWAPVQWNNEAGVPATPTEGQRELARPPPKARAPAPVHARPVGELALAEPPPGFGKVVTLTGVIRSHEGTSKIEFPPGVLTLRWLTLEVEGADPKSKIEYQLEGSETVPQKKLQDLANKTVRVTGTTSKSNFGGCKATVKVDSIQSQ